MDTKKRKRNPFYACQSFEGFREGYIFTTSSMGTGYYLDSYSIDTEELEDLDKDIRNKVKRLKQNENTKTTHSGKENGEEEWENSEEFLREAIEKGEFDEEIINKLLEANEKRSGHIDKLDTAGVKKRIVALEKKTNVNQELRLKYGNEPLKFLDSESELDTQIKTMSSISAAPEQYIQLITLNTIPTLLGLLTHENTDISVSTLSTLSFLTETKTIEEANQKKYINPESPEEEHQDGHIKEQEYMGVGEKFIDIIIDNKGAEILVQNLQRLDERKDEESDGIYNTILILSNIITEKFSMCEYVCNKTNLVDFLLRRLLYKKFDSTIYICSELLDNLVFHNDKLNLGSVTVSFQNNLTNAYSEEGGLDILLQVIDRYRRETPSCSEEMEFIENVFNTLNTSLLVPGNKPLFGELQGPQLLMQCIRKQSFLSLNAYKSLDFSLQNCITNVDILIKEGGLKLLFPAFMGRGLKSLLGNKKKNKELRNLQAHIASILAQICIAVSIMSNKGGAAHQTPNESGVHKSSSQSTSDNFYRLLSKFLEENYEKTDRVIKKYLSYKVLFSKQELKVQNRRQYGEASSDDDDYDENDELSSLQPLQEICIVLAFLCSFSEECQRHIIKRFKDEKEEIGNVAILLSQYIQALGEEEENTKESVKGKEEIHLSDLKQLLRQWANTLLIISAK